MQLFIQQLYTHIWFNPLSVDMLVSILVQNLGRWPCWCQSGKEDKIRVKKEMHFNFFCPGFGLISCVLDCLISCVLVCLKFCVGKILVCWPSSYFIQ